MVYSFVVKHHVDANKLFYVLLSLKATTSISCGNGIMQQRGWNRIQMWVGLQLYVLNSRQGLTRSRRRLWTPIHFPSPLRVSYRPRIFGINKSNCHAKRLTANGTVVLDSFSSRRSGPMAPSVSNYAPMAKAMHINALVTRSTGSSSHWMMILWDFEG